jgi:hypothetical protein
MGSLKTLQKIFNIHAKIEKECVVCVAMMGKSLGIFCREEYMMGL